MKNWSPKKNGWFTALFAGLIALSLIAASCINTTASTTTAITSTLTTTMETTTTTPTWNNIQLQGPQHPLQRRRLLQPRQQ